MSRATELYDLVTSFLESKVLNPSGMYRFFPAQAEGDDVSFIIRKMLKQKLREFQFPRQQEAAVFYV